MSAITHAKDQCAGAILQTLAAALRSLGETPEHNIFAELTELGLGDHPAAADIWRKLMAVDLAFYRSETSNRLRAEGHEIGVAEERAASVLRTLQHREIDVPDDAHTRISSCRDLDILADWADRAFTVAQAEDLFDDDH